MAFAIAARNSRMAEMNITPLVDVMLVLLIIFMVTMPLRTYGITVDLPQRGPPPDTTPAKPVDLRIDAMGLITWNGSAVPLNALTDVMRVESGRYTRPLDQPVIQIQTDPNANYGTLATVLAAAKNAGLVRIGFVDNP